MKKHKLPKSCTGTVSRSCPDKVHYCNVKTGESSWKKPTLDQTNQSITQSSAMPRKRKTEEVDGTQCKTTMPEQNPSNNQDRKKLRARRKVPVVQPIENKDKETPQMQALRNKIAEKKIKTQPIQKSGPKNIPETSKLPEIQSSVVDTLKETVSSKSLPSVKKASVLKDIPPPKIEKFTPEMRAIYEKMLQRKSKPGSSRRSDISDVKTSTASSNSTSSKRLRRRTSVFGSKSDNGRSTTTHSSTSGSTSTSGTTSSSGTTSTSGTATASTSSSTVSTESKQSKVVGENLVHSNVSPKQKNSSTTPVNLEAKKMRIQSVEKVMGTPNRRATLSRISRPSSLKKNIAKDRMENLRQSLDHEDKSRRNFTKSQLGIYKNVQVRLQRLHNKIIKDYSPCETNGTQLENRKKPEHAAPSFLNEITAAENLVKNCVETRHEEMDWEPMEDERVMFEVQSIRNYLGTERHLGQSNFVPEHTLDVPLRSQEEELQMLYIVVDTNVLLSNISAIEEAKDTAFKIYGRPIIVIPWTVIRELDYIKDDKSNTRSEALRSNARRAVRFLHQYFSAKHPRVVAQKHEDAIRNKQKYEVDCPDDEILHTCLQIREQNKAVVLLSYDKNLCNKAMIYDIVTIGRNDPVEKVDYLNASENSFANLHSQTLNSSSRLSLSMMQEELQVADEIYEDTKDILKNFLSVIVIKEMQNLYSDNWEKYTIIQPPWTTFKVLKCALKHWIAAVSESFLRQAEPILKDLLEIVRKQPDGGHRLEDVAHMLEKCSDLIQMVHINKYPELMARASKSIDELKQKCLKHDIRIHEKRLREEIGYENDPTEQERRAIKAFQYFEVVYAYARDFGGFAAAAVGMPCSFFYKDPIPAPNIEYVRRLQPEIAANVNRLLHSLSTAIKQVNNSCVDRRTLIGLYHALTTFLSDALTVPADLEPLDVYCCLKQKEQLLKTGITQLQELSVHYCRLASFRSS